MLIPKADGGARPVAIVNTIVRLAKAYALHLGGKVFMRIFEEDKLQHMQGGMHPLVQKESYIRLKRPSV